MCVSCSIDLLSIFVAVKVLIKKTHNQTWPEFGQYSFRGTKSYLYELWEHNLYTRLKLSLNDEEQRHQKQNKRQRGKKAQRACFKKLQLFTITYVLFSFFMAKIIKERGGSLKLYHGRFCDIGKYSIFQRIDRISYHDKDSYRAAQHIKNLPSSHHLSTCVI